MEQKNKRQAKDGSLGCRLVREPHHQKPACFLLGLLGHVLGLVCVGRWLHVPARLPSGWLFAGTGRGLAAAPPRPREPRAAPPRAAAGPLGSRDRSARRPAGFSRADCSFPRSSTRTEAKEGKSENEHRTLQLQITHSNLNGFEQDSSHRSVATRPNRSEKKLAKRSRIHHESSEKSKPLPRTCVWGKLRIQADS